MTNNIVIEFSSSIWKESESERAVLFGKSVGDFKVYPVVSGSTFNEQFNETLDSATVVLSQVQKEDRLIGIKPYDYVRVYDASGNTNLNKLFLIDNFSEKENNIRDHIYGYTINLMSETKILEKIQCPNLSITHSLSPYGAVQKKTIYQYIKQYMELYVPKVKFSDGDGTWSYEPVIRLRKLLKQTKIVPFNENNFTYASTLFNFSVSSTALGSDVDENTVKVNSYKIERGPSDLEITNLSFSSGAKTFLITGTSSTVESGYIQIEYSYSVYETEEPLYKRFDVPCADMGSGNFTLRQLLTMLMQQVGCIPTVKNRTLSFLDFQLEGQDFGENGDYSLDGTVNYINRSLSSDSYVNTLVNMSSGVLDSGNEIICERLGFRDRNNVLIKVTQNLKLETKFPIFKINKAIMNAVDNVNFRIKAVNGKQEITSPLSPTTRICYCSTGLAYIGFDTSSQLRRDTPYTTMPLNTLTFANFKYSDSDLNENTDDRTLQNLVVTAYEAVWDTTKKIYSNFVFNRKIIFHGSISTSPYSSGSMYRYHYNASYSYTDENGYFHFNIAVSPSSSEVITNADITGFANIELDANVYVLDLDWTGAIVPSNNVSVFYVNAENINETTDESNVLFTPVLTSTIPYAAQSVVSAKLSADITPLIVENSIRQNLKVNFQEMGDRYASGNLNTLEQLAEYVYGTLGYSINSNEITGFSTMYSEGQASALGWLTYEYTYLENIIRFLIKNSLLYPSSNDVLEIFKIDFIKDPLTEEINFMYVADMESYSNNNNEQVINIADCKKWVGMLNFDIYYQPLNSFNLAYTKSKEDIDYPIQQYDGNASGLTDFDRLSIHEQEQVDRIGNETLFINQRTDEYDNILTFDQGPLIFQDVSRDDTKYVIFKRSFTVNNNCFNANYVGSKDAVLKDYFTSIRTKYRAYQYVDYSQSVLRKERENVFIRIGREDYYNGDDKIYGANMNDFVPRLLPSNLENRKVLYSFKKGDGILPDKRLETQLTKNDVSAIVNQNSIAFIFEDYDNVGEGTYLSHVTVDTELGGAHQEWQIWSDSYRTAHEVGFLNVLKEKIYYANPAEKYPFNDVDWDLANPVSAIVQTLYKNYTLFVNQFMSSFPNEPFYLTQVKTIKLPIVDTDAYDYSISFQITDDNTALVPVKHYYQDLAERINQTVQFTYYATDDSIIWTQLFLQNAPITRREEAIPTHIVDISNEEFAVSEETNEIGSEISEINDNYIEINDNVLTVKWNNLNSGVTQIKVVIKDTHNKYRDLVAFKKPSPTEETTNYYFCFNDTKTDYVMSEQNGVLYRKYKVKTLLPVARETEENPEIYDVEE